jgi:glutathione S-transferase
MRPMITFHTFAGRYGLESLSPFCMKAEVYLKLRKLEYERKSGGDPRKAPKQKLPMIEDDATIVCDSTAIIDYLEKKAKHPLDEGLSEQDWARARFIQRTFEEGLYFVALWSRWAEDDGWNVTKTFFDAIPGAVRWAIVPMARKKVIASTHAQGTGRHSREEIYEIGKRDLRAFATLLGDAKYVLGDRVRTVDCTAYAFLANILVAEIDSPLKEYAKTLPKLSEYVERMKETLNRPT